MLLSILEIIGVISFGISGVLTAANRKLDYFGATVVAFFTALGGGTIRDLLLNTEIVWMQNVNLISSAFGGAVLGIVFRKHLYKWRSTLFIFDTIGLGLFSVLGMQKGLDFGCAPIVALMLGVISASFGGVIRDILCNRIPLIFREEIYATAALGGGILFLILHHFNWLPQLDMLISILVIIGIRLLSVKFGWKMPNLKNDKELENDGK